MDEASQAPRRNGDMADEYDFSGGVRGKYAQRYATGSEVVVLSPDSARDSADPQKARIGPGRDVGAAAGQRRPGRRRRRATEA